MHYHVRCPTAAHPPSHHQAGSDQLVLFFFFFLFFIFACSYSTLFYKNWNLFCVLCLDYVRNEVRSACSFSFFFFFFFFHFLFFILFFFLSFHFHPRFISFFLFSFSCFSPPHKTHNLLLFILFFTSRSFQRFTSEREREAWASTACISTAPRRPPHQLAWVKSAFFFLFLFFFIFACSDSTLF